MFPIPVETILRGALIFIRVGGILFALPIFGDQPTPVRVRILLAVALSFALLPIIPPEWGAKLPHDALSMGILVVKELAIGLVIGFVARAAFEGILLGASLVGYQMGFGTASLFMPDHAESMNSFTALHRIVVIMIFLLLDLHHIFFKGIVDAFMAIPDGQAGLHAPLARILIDITAQIFTVGLQLAAPILVALLFTMAALGLVARTVPQMNVFVMSFPASFFVGLFVYIATIPLYPGWIESHYRETADVISGVLRGLKP